MEEIPEHEGYKFRVARPRTDFRGTHQYASPNAHMLIELGRHDDIWSLMYMVAESFVELPWTGCEETEVEHYKNQSTILRLFSDEKNPTRLNADMRRQLDEIYSMLKASKYYDSPNYDAVYQFFKDSMAKAKVTWDTPFDWEIGNTLSEETSKGVKRKMGGPWENPGLFFKKGCWAGLKFIPELTPKSAPTSKKQNLPKSSSKGGRADRQMSKEDSADGDDVVVNQGTPAQKSAKQEKKEKTVEENV